MLDYIVASTSSTRGMQGCSGITDVSGDDSLIEENKLNPLHQLRECFTFSLLVITVTDRDFFLWIGLLFASTTCVYDVVPQRAVCKIVRCCQ